MLGIGKTISLRLLMHLIGDIHQPLHTRTLFDHEKFKRGDAGGNKYRTMYRKKSKRNFHAFWDYVVDQHGSVKADISSRDLKRLTKL